MCGDLCSCLENCSRWLDVGQPLELQRQQHAPREGTAAAPVNLDCHRAVRALGVAAIVTTTAQHRKCIARRRIGDHHAHHTHRAAELARRISATRDWAIIDCRFDLAQPAGARAPGRRVTSPRALYADLDRDLSGPRGPRHAGVTRCRSSRRSPQRSGGSGIDARVQVVAYDQGPGTFAARLWWLLRWLGHAAVAVLNGGFAAWQRAGLPVTSTEARARGARFQCARGTRRCR